MCWRSPSSPDGLISTSITEQLGIGVDDQRPDPVAEIEHHRLGAHLVRVVVVIVVVMVVAHVSTPGVWKPSYGRPDVREVVR